MNETKHTPGLGMTRYHLGTTEEADDLDDNSVEFYTVDDCIENGDWDTIKELAENGDRDARAAIGKATGANCKRCGSSLDGQGYCRDETCPHENHLQHETWTEG